jgi:hypothetical protein
LLVSSLAETLNSGVVEKRLLAGTLRALEAGSLHFTSLHLSLDQVACLSRWPASRFNTQMLTISLPDLCLDVGIHCCCFKPLTGQ